MIIIIRAEQFLMKQPKKIDSKPREEEFPTKEMAKLAKQVRGLGWESFIEEEQFDQKLGKEFVKMSFGNPSFDDDKVAAAQFELNVLAKAQREYNEEEVDWWRRKQPWWRRKATAEGDNECEARAVIGVRWSDSNELMAQRLMKKAKMYLFILLDHMTEYSTIFNVNN